MNRNSKQSGKQNACSQVGNNISVVKRRLSGAVGRASPIWSLGFATRRLSGAVRGGLREEEVERRGGTSFADLVTGLRNEAVERHGGTSFATSG
uniref:Uncharacterized protein n=1 Tax=Fagus sylvatica TaxID=28930 RepID=A0A2N9IKX3_FAGSY